LWRLLTHCFSSADRCDGTESLPHLIEKENSSTSNTESRAFQRGKGIGLRRGVGKRGMAINPPLTVWCCFCFSASKGSQSPCAFQPWTVGFGVSVADNRLGHPHSLFSLFSFVTHICVGLCVGWCVGSWESPPAFPRRVSASGKSCWFGNPSL